MFLHRFPLALVDLEVSRLEARILIPARVQDFVEVPESFAVAQLELLDCLCFADDFEHPRDVLAVVGSDLTLLVLPLDVLVDVEGWLSPPPAERFRKLLSCHLLLDSA